MKNIHPLQTIEWGQFREKTGVKIIRENGYQISIHPIPHTKFTIGYFPKGENITQEMLDILLNIGKKENCIFIQIEPNIEKLNQKYNFKNLYTSARPLFTKYNFVLDLTQSDEELLKNMNQKTRYNIKLARKKGVTIIENDSQNAFDEYLRLTKETTTRQKFFAHTPKYHTLMWNTLKNKKFDPDKLSAHLFQAIYQNKTLAAWILFTSGDTLYYPYGASSSENREVMASNLLMWEAILYGKRLGLKKFDMWGALGENANTNDPWFGFHKFKQGYGPRHVEYVGSFDFVINPKLYKVYILLNKIRWFILKIK